MQLPWELIIYVVFFLFHREAQDDWTRIMISIFVISAFWEVRACLHLGRRNGQLDADLLHNFSQIAFLF